MQVMTVTHDSGVVLHVQYSEMYQAIRDLHSAGLYAGAIPPAPTRGMRKPEVLEKATRARKRSDECFLIVERALEAMLTQAVEDTWERAMAAQKPFRCSACRERFLTAQQLLEHAIANGTTTGDTCWLAFEADLRVTSTLVPAEPKGESNAT